MRFRVRSEFLLWLIAALMLVGGITVDVRAQDDDAADETLSLEEQEARELFDAGRLALRQGRFDEALERFERAYELSPRAEMLYNIGYAADRAGREPRAIEAYEAFLVERPEHEERLAIEARVVVLRRGEGGAVTDLTPPPTDHEPATQDPAAGASSTQGGERVATWVLGASALAVALAAGALYLHATLAYDDLASSCAPNCGSGAVDPLRAEVLASQILWPVAGAALIGAIIAFFVEAPASDAEPSARLLLGPTGGGLHVSF